MAKYRVSFEYEAEDPVHAVIYLVGLIETPDMRDIRFDWMVTEVESGKETKVSATLEELEKIAKEDIDQFLRGTEGSPQ